MATRAVFFFGNRFSLLVVVSQVFDGSVKRPPGEALFKWPHFLLGDEPFTNGVERQFRQALQMQLLHDVGTMRLYRIYAEVQKIGYFFV